MWGLAPASSKASRSKGLFGGSKARRCIHVCGAHKRWSVATAGVLLSKLRGVRPASSEASASKGWFGGPQGGAYMSLGDIHNMPSFWVLALFCNFYTFCFHVQTCRNRGEGGCVYFLKSARKRHFRNVWVGGGGFAIFQRSTTHWMVHTNMALHRSSIFTQNHCHRQHSFFQAGLGTPLGQTSP